MINKNVLKLLAKEANKDSVYNLLFAIIQHMSNKYDHNGDKVNNILGIITGNKLISPIDINLDKVIEHSDWLYKTDNYKVTSSIVEFVDNISCSANIKYKYKYTSGSDKQEYESSFDISYIDYPDIIDYESVSFEV